MASLIDVLRARLAILLLIARYRTRMIRYALTARPIAGGAPDDDKDDDSAAAAASASDDDAGDGDNDADEDDDADDDGKKPAAGEQDWKRMARKHERESKRARRERDEFEKKLKQREDADKSQQDKAIEDAEKRARESLQAEHDKERRQDRLEVATTKLAAKGLKIGSGDDAKTVRFADADDAMVYLERDISSGDLDPEDIFDQSGRVNASALEEALSDLLARKPHLAASDTGTKKVTGSADAGKGKPAKTDSSVEDHLNSIRRHKPAAAR